MSSRISYDDDDEDAMPFGLWKQTQRLAINGKRGQAVLRELEAALLALPRKRLIEGAVCDGTDVCTTGALLLHRRIAGGEERPDALRRMAVAWPDQDFDPLEAGVQLQITRTLAWRLVELNDEDLAGMTPEQRYVRVLAWVRRALGEGASDDRD